MRKNLIKFTLIVCFYTMNSCGSEITDHTSADNFKNTSGINKVGNINRSSNEKLDRFVDNKNLQNIIENIEAYKKSSAADDVNEQHKAIDIIVSSSHSLVEDYGGDQQTVLSILEELRINDSSPSQKYYYGNGDKCHRNSNGTVNSDACSFWEEVVVAFSGAFNCNNPGAGASSSAWNTYYNCYQSIVCKTC